MSKFKKNYSKIIITIIISISISLLSLYLMIGNITNLSKLITLLVSFIFSSKYLYKNFTKLYHKIITNKISSIISLILTSIIFYKLTISINKSNIITRFYHLKEIYYLIIPGLYLVITTSFINIKDWLKSFIKKMTTLDKKIYILLSIVMFILLFILYSHTNYFYTQYDEIYSMDSGWIYKNFIPDPHYYDIRHTITSILVFPIYAIISFIFNTQLTPIILQFINIQLLILIGFELKILTNNNKWVFLFYILSFPTLLFSIFFEKYILIVFLMVTYLYNTFINKKHSYLTLILSIGTMTSSFFIALTELFQKIYILEKIKKINEIIILAILVIIMTGRIHCFTGFYKELTELHFKTPGLTITEKFISTTKMIEHSIIALPSSHHTFTSQDNIIPNNIYHWNDVTNKISYLGIPILIIIALGINNLYQKNKRLCTPFILTLSFAFILFMILNWAVTESPLFSIYFSWAIIPLFVYGLDKLFNIFKIKSQYHKYIYFLILILITYTNINGFIDMYQYIIKF